MQNKIYLYEYELHSAAMCVKEVEALHEHDLCASWELAWLSLPHRILDFVFVDITFARIIPYPSMKNTN